MLDFQIPRITSESAEQNRGTFTIEPLDRAERRAIAEQFADRPEGLLAHASAARNASSAAFSSPSCRRGSRPR